MTPEQLKASILQYAIQGKLVPQDPSEGTGEELYQQIQEEKQRLIKEGKLKKGKPLAEIAEDEIPFDIPESWKWVRFGEVYSLSNGIASRGTKGGTSRPVLRLADLSDGIVNVGNIRSIELSEKEFQSHRVEKDDLIFIRVNGTKARVATAFHYKGEEAISYCDHLFCGNKVSEGIFADYIMHVFNAASTRKQLLPEIKTTAGQNTISQASMAKMILPLPPLAEQHRIVAKIEELLPYVDRYAAAYEKLEQFNASFPKDMKKSVLQYAIQGKLVPQDPSEGTGEELYQQIQEEKQRLIKEGKLKKGKPLAEIAEDEIPFDIPESWKWVRVQSVVTLNPKNEIDDDVDAGFIPMTLVSDGFRNLHSFEVKKWGDIKKGFSHFADGDIGVAKITPCFQNRKSVIFRNLPNGCGAGTTELTISRVIGETLNREYLLWFFKTAYFIENGVKSFTGTAGQQRIHKDYLANCLLPLPPLAEQHRIVAKLEEILPLCDRLK